MGTQQHFAVALVVRVLLEARGEFEKSNVQVSNMANKILKWMRLYQEKGMEGLQSKVGKQPGQHESKRKFNLELIKEAILALGSSGGHHCYSAYYRYYLELERAKNPHFSAHYSKFVDHARKLIEGDKRIQIFLKKGKDGLLQRYPVGIKQKEYINAEWQVDSTRIDFMMKIKDPSAKKGYRVARKVLSAVIDSFSGSAFAQLIDSNSSTSQLKVLFNAFKRLGVPDKIRHDNGSDYASAHYQGFLKANKIESVACTPYEGRQKGKIERFFGVLHSKLEWLPGYIGNDVSKRQKIEAQNASKKDTLSGKATRINEDDLLFEDELQYIIEHTLAQQYNNYSAHAPLIPSADELAKIYNTLGKAHQRTVRAFGVEINNQTYTSAQIWEKCAIGDSVIVVENPDDPAQVSLYTPNKEFIGVANSTHLGAECMDLEEFRKTKSRYLKTQVNPFLKSIVDARQKASAHRKKKVGEILAQRVEQKKPLQEAMSKQEKIKQTLEQIRKAAGYEWLGHMQGF